MCLYYNISTSKYKGARSIGLTKEESLHIIPYITHKNAPKLYKYQFTKSIMIISPVSYKLNIFECYENGKPVTYDRAELIHKWELENLPKDMVLSIDEIRDMYNSKRKKK